MMQERAWQGVRMRRVAVGPEPDAPPRPLRLPAGWDDAAAAALAALAPGTGPATLADAAEAWIGPIAAQAAASGVTLPLADRLRHLLLHRRGAPGPAVWHGNPAAAPDFVLNLAAFHDGTGFDVAAFADAVATAVWALSLAAPSADRLRIAVTDLATLLASLGLDYDSQRARGVAEAVARLFRTAADLASAAVARHAGISAGQAAAPPRAREGDLPEIAAWAVPSVPAGTKLRHAATTAILAPGEADALLGVQHGGIAPAFSPLASDGRLSAASRARLAALGLTAEAALAALYAGHDLLPVAGAEAHDAMHDAVAPFIHAMPARPRAVRPAPADSLTPAFEELPARRRGYTQRAGIGGHRVYLRTGEYPDGRLGEFAVSLPRESASVRAMMDALATAISIGLQHGVGLRPYVDALANTRFAPSGTVEGDPAVAEAASPVDYVMRTLAASYLGLTDIPAEPHETAADHAPESARPAPQLPLDLPHAPAAKRRGLRLVS